MPANPAITPALRRRDYRLGDNLWARQGQVFITGTQALVRLPLMQRWLDEAAGLDTRGFVSGYRGSPLGMVDQQIWKAGTPWKEAGLTFVPAINEELAATQVLGTQRVESDPEKTCDAVFALWYGKGPGVDRAGDALKHGNAYGSSPHGGVLVVAGDDHGCVSSSMPHQSDQLFQAFHMPIVAPANVAEHLEFGLYGWALSRFSGHWVGLTSLSEVVESGATVDLDAIHARVAAWKSADDVGAATGFMPPAQGLHYRWPDLPSLQIEERLAHKLRAVAAFSAVNSIDRQVIESPLATVGGRNVVDVERQDLERIAAGTTRPKFSSCGSCGRKWPTRRWSAPARMPASTGAVSRIRALLAPPNPSWAMRPRKCARRCAVASTRPVIVFVPCSRYGSCAPSTKNAVPW